MIMPFTKQEFEAALPKGFWQEAGMISGEYCYTIKVKDGVYIMIRSTVEASGYSRETGEDSIRMWLMNDHGESLGGKLTRWIARTTNWQNRMIVQLRQFWKIGQLVGPCNCGDVRKAFKVKKEGLNKGLPFVACNKCKYFKWITL